MPKMISKPIDNRKFRDARTDLVIYRAKQASSR
jgi:hypothetical protein